jgi:hypothetical protein
MTFAYLSQLGIVPFSIALPMEECVSAVLLQRILFPFSLLVTLKSANVYVAVPPLLALAIPSPVFAYLD